MCGTFSDALLHERLFSQRYFWKTSLKISVKTNPFLLQWRVYERVFLVLLGVFFLAKQEKYHAHKAVQNHKLLILHCDLWEIKNKAKHINK